MPSLDSLMTRLNSETLQSFGHLLAGGSSGAIALVLLYPIEQLSTRLTVGEDSTARIITARSIINDFIHFRIENIFDIYRGLRFGIFEKFMFDGIYFFFYNILKDDWTKRHNGDMPMRVALFRGSVAGICTQLFTFPLSTIQKILQTTDKEDAEHSNASIIFINIAQKHGVSAFWSGIGMSVPLAINPAINMFAYERIRRYIQTTLGSQSILIDFIAGLCSKAVATIVCYPLIYIKVRQQTEIQKDEKSASAVEFVKEAYKKGGIKQFYSGLTSKLLQSSLSNAMMLMIKERVTVSTFAFMVYFVEIKRKQLNARALAMKHRQYNII